MLTGITILFEHLWSKWNWSGRRFADYSCFSLLCQLLTFVDLEWNEYRAVLILKGVGPFCLRKSSSKRGKHKTHGSRYLINLHRSKVTLALARIIIVVFLEVKLHSWRLRRATNSLVIGLGKEIKPLTRPMNRQLLITG